MLRSDAPSELLLVRHGQVTVDGPAYDGLSAKGRSQAQSVGAALADQGIAPLRVHIGTMSRHRETAEFAAGAAGWSAPLAVDERWNEFDHVAILSASGAVGREERSLVGDESRRRLFELALPRWSSGLHDEDYPESFRTFRERVSTSLRQVAQSAPPGETVLIVSSAGVISWITTQLLGGTRERWLALAPTWVNASVTRLQVSDGKVRLVSSNDYAHLSDDLVTFR